MFRRGAIRWMVVLALAAALASPALASPRGQTAGEALHLGSWWEAVVSWFASGDRGWMIDPDGGTSNSEGDRGISMDPNG